jgi:hypothetical protein
MAYWRLWAHYLALLKYQSAEVELPVRLIPQEVLESPLLWSGLQKSVLALSRRLYRLGVES